MQLSQFFSFITFSLLALVAAAPTAETLNFEISRRDVSGADILGLVQELATGVNGLTSHTKQSKWSRSGASDEFKSAVSNVKSTADNFATSSSSYDINANPVNGLVSALLGLVAAIVDLVIQVYLWVLLTGFSLVEEVVTAVFQLIFIIFNALVPLSNAGSFGALAYPLSNGLTFAENISRGFGIQV